MDHQTRQNWVLQGEDGELRTLLQWTLDCKPGSLDSQVIPCFSRPSAGDETASYKHLLCVTDYIERLMSVSQGLFSEEAWLGITGC